MIKNVLIVTVLTIAFFTFIAGSADAAGSVYVNVQITSPAPAGGWQLYILEPNIAGGDVVYSTTIYDTGMHTYPIGPASMMVEGTYTVRVAANGYTPVDGALGAYWPTGYGNSFVYDSSDGNYYRTFTIIMGSQISPTPAPEMWMVYYRIRIPTAPPAGGWSVTLLDPNDNIVDSRQILDTAGHVIGIGHQNLMVQGYYHLVVYASGYDTHTTNMYWPSGVGGSPWYLSEGNYYTTEQIITMVSNPEYYIALDINAETVPSGGWLVEVVRPTGSIMLSETATTNNIEWYHLTGTLQNGFYTVYVSGSGYTTWSGTVQYPTDFIASQGSNFIADLTANMGSSVSPTPTLTPPGSPVKVRFHILNTSNGYAVPGMWISTTQTSGINYGYQQQWTADAMGIATAYSEQNVMLTWICARGSTLYVEQTGTVPIGSTDVDVYVYLVPLSPDNGMPQPSIGPDGSYIPLTQEQRGWYRDETMSVMIIALPGLLGLFALFIIVDVVKRKR